MEDFLAMIYAHLCGGGSPAAQLAYGSIMAHGTRNDMLEVAVDAALASDEPVRQELSSFVKLVRKFSPRRNEIAHGRVVYVTGKFTGCYLTPPVYQTNKSFWSMRRAGTPDANVLGKYQYTAEQIDAFAGRFTDLQNEALKWMMRIGQPQAQQVQPPEPRT